MARLERLSGENAGLYAYTLGSLGAGPNYQLSLTSAPAQFEILKADQTITFGVLANKALGDPDFTVSATSNSGLVVSFSTGTTSVCTVTLDGLVHLVGAGNCTIAADQDGNGNYNAAAQVEQTFEVVLNNSVTTLVTSGSPSTYGETVTLTATVTAGATGNVRFYDGAALIGIVAANEGTPNHAVLETSALNVADFPHSITAEYFGDATHAGSTSSAISQAVGPAALSVTAKNASKTYDGLAYSGGYDVTYLGFVNGETETVLGGTLAYGGTSQDAVAVGDYTIIPSGLTSANYTITFHNGTLTINKADQTITFNSTAPSAAKVGETYTPVATATSGLPVTFAIDLTTSTVCSISSGVVTFKAVGNCKINADQLGDGTYNAAPQAQQSFDIAKGDQTITFTSTAPAYAQITDTYTPTATASSNLVVTFSIDATTPTICSISSGVVTFNAVGTCKINADQDGSANYNAAPQVQQSIDVGKADQTISFNTAAPAHAVVGGSYTPDVTSTSGLLVALTIDDASTAVCSISLGVVSFDAVGTCTINANQAGNEIYDAALQVQQSFDISPFIPPTYTIYLPFLRR